MNVFKEERKPLRIEWGTKKAFEEQQEPQGKFKKLIEEKAKQNMSDIELIIGHPIRISIPLVYETIDELKKEFERLKAESASLNEYHQLIDEWFGVTHG